MRNIQQKLAQLAKQIDLKLNKKDNNIGIYDTDDQKKNEAKRKRVEATKKKLVLLSKTKSSY